MSLKKQSPVCTVECKKNLDKDTRSQSAIGPTVSKYKYCQSTFQEKYTFDTRQEQCYSIKSMYPDKLPIIIEKLKNITSPVSDIAKNKFLIPDDLVVSQLMCIIRKYIELSSADSIYLFANDTLISSSESLYNTYGKYKHTDGFLYIYYTTENTFGS